MNEYLALELISQRTTERYAEAERASLVRRLRLARRQRNRDEALVRRPVPDYMDGSFRTADEQVEAKPVGAVTVTAGARRQGGQRNAGIDRRTRPRNRGNGRNVRPRRDASL